MMHAGFPKGKKINRLGFLIFDRSMIESKSAILLAHLLREGLGAGLFTGQLAKKPAVACVTASPVTRGCRSTGRVWGGGDARNHHPSDQQYNEKKMNSFSHSAFPPFLGRSATQSATPEFSKPLTKGSP
jgi:hypothetical protein